MWATLVRMYKTEGGISALYRGIIPTVAGVAPYVSRLNQFPSLDVLTDCMDRSDSTSWFTSQYAQLSPEKVNNIPPQ